MSPPVSNAVQGAFFVAALITGMLFGGLALIFSDLTEGLGCLLGGFCISMWFLSLKEGGVITSTTGRAIFISCMSVAGFSLSFSHYTRTYGLIGAISFSGATIAMLGVDCFSRAGWKEFWLYLWSLNDDVFPLNTNTYPLTKGLRAELAGVVIFTVFGVISQLRLWRLVKERRAKREEQAKEQAESQQIHEAELGREIEDRFQKERREWEARYEGKGASDAGGESSSASTLSEQGHPGTAHDSKVDLSEPEKEQPVVDVASVHDDDEILQVDAPRSPVAQDGLVVRSAQLSRSNSARPSSEIMGPSRMSRTISVAGSLKPSSSPPPPPVIVPLPFKIPQEDAISHASDNASVSALPDTEEVPLTDEQPISRRASARPTMKRLSTAKSSVDGFQSEDVVLLSQIEDDRGSSVAATWDEEDVISLPELSRPSSLVEDDNKTEPTATDSSSLKSEDGRGVQDNSGFASGEEAGMSSSTPTIDVQLAESLDDGSHTYGSASSLSHNGPRQSLTVSLEPKHDTVGAGVSSPRSPRPRHDTLVKGDSEKSASAKSDVEDFASILRPRLSKVAQSYRTNEWAKHLEAAEKPEVDEISEPSSPGAQLDHEQPAPVSEGIAQPFAVAKRASKRVSSDSNMHRKNAFMRITSNSDLQSQVELPTVVTRQSSFELGRRISSVPIQAPIKTQTLLGHRESLMRNRVSTQNFNQLMVSPIDPTVAAPADEDMTLAQRRRALKHQKPPSAAQKWKKSSWAVSPPVGDFDSHQPKRTVGSGSDQRREDLLAGWRGSMQQTNAPLQSAAGREEQQRAAMMNATRQKEMEQQQQAAMAYQRESMRDNMMRSSSMLDAHRDAMRRMQAAANQKV